ncbi:MAG TPA: chemotaxis protein [Rhodospirillaceae bacterium]|nr:chemotaxis protein [Rhodospirillaceae bacterium]
MFFNFGRIQDIEAKLAALNKSQAVIEFQLDGSILTANENFLSTFGYRLDEIQGKHHSMFVDSSFRDTPDYKQFWENLRNGKFQAAQYKRIGKGGKEIWIEASYNPISKKNGEIYKIVKFATDITHQKMKNADFEGKLNAVDKSQAIIEFTLEGVILTANENFLSTLGYRLDEIQGKYHNMFVAPDSRDTPEYKKFWDDLRNGKFQAAQYKRIGKGGKEIWIEGSYNPIVDLNGKPFKIVKFATDISKNIEQLKSIKQNMGSYLSRIEDAVCVVNQQTAAASNGATETSANVQTVAAGAEQLHASVVEISQTMSNTATAADEAFQKVVETDIETKKLLAAAQAMSGIVSLIQKIAEQVNLLSLNATIEAARAGEAGKGFAVVASEVKNLATQVADATHQIGGEINNIQEVVAVVANGLQTIMTTIDNARGYVAGVAGAVEEQSAVARDMSSNMQNASEAMHEVSGNLGYIINALEDVKASVDQTKLVSDAITN